MGMFDTVEFKCPFCNQKTDLQSKSGECAMEHYTLEDVPMAVATGAYGRCNHCNIMLALKPNCIPTWSAFVIEDEYV